MILWWKRILPNDFVEEKDLVNDFVVEKDFAK
jgi:hypothetical protein